MTVRSTSAIGRDAKTAALSIGKNDGATSVTTSDGVQIFYKDWGPRSAQPIVFHHGWPLSADDWDAQMLFFLGKSFRVIAHDRRGHGRSSQVGDGHDMDHYAADIAALAEHLDLRNAIHVGHSTGGGEATRYVARHGRDRVAKLVLIGAVPPLMLRTESNPGGLPLDVFDGLRPAARRQPVAILFRVRERSLLWLQSSRRRGLTGRHLELVAPGACIGRQQGPLRLASKPSPKPTSAEDLKNIAVPTLVLHGGDDQIVPVADSAQLSVRLLKRGTIEGLRPATAWPLHDASRHRQCRPAQGS
ncbi:alpha/beta fold hydrolase [Bradyrhizobium betae]